MNFTNLEAVHASLQGADGIDFSHVHDTAHGLETLTAAFADLTVTTDDNLFASEHNVGRSLQTVNYRFPTRVQIVESERKKKVCCKKNRAMGLGLNGMTLKIPIEM